MRDEAVIALVIVLVIASAGAGYFIGNSSQRTTTTVSTTALVSTTTLTSTSVQTIAMQTSTYCTISAEGTGFYVTVETDSGLPVAGAQVSGTTVTEVAETTCEQSIGSQYTNSTGTVSIPDNIGSYNALTVQYQGKNYAIKAPIVPMETTYVTLRVPSGNYSVSEVFEGGCTKTASGVACPG